MPVVALAVCGLLGCGGQRTAGDVGTGPDLEAGSDDGRPSGDGSVGGPLAVDGSASYCTSASDRQGCACAAGTPPRACASSADSGCVVGHQACLGNSEGAAWGPCTGDAGGCGSPEAGPRPDAGPSTVYASGCAPLSVGDEHACAITPSGGLKCWGNNISGQLGIGGNPNLGYNTANDVVGLTSGVACVAAGGAQTCALTKAGSVKCWGDPWNDGSLSGWGGTPVDVPGLSSGAIGLASGVFDTCALLADGGVQCWGGGGDAEFGTNTMYRSSPQTIAGVPTGVVAVQMSDGFGCVLTRGGAVECWGGNTFGELGNGTTFSSVVPVPVTGLGSGIASIWANGGTAACAVLTGGSLKCWGSGPAPGGAAPVDVTGLPGPVRSASVGAEKACVLLTDGSVLCWPDGVWPSGVGDGGASGPATPVSGLPPAQFVAINQAGKCALAGGKVYCWSSWSSQSNTPIEIAGF